MVDVACFSTLIGHFPLITLSHHKYISVSLTGVNLEIEVICVLFLTYLLENRMDKL